MTKQVYYNVDADPRTVTATYLSITFVLSFIVLCLQVFKPSILNHYFNQTDLSINLYIFWIFVTIILPGSASTFEALSYAFLFLTTVFVTYVVLNYHVNFNDFINTSLRLWLLIRFSCLVTVIIGFVNLGTGMFDRLQDSGGLSPSVLGLTSSLGIIISLVVMQITKGYKQVYNFMNIIIFSVVLVLSVHKSSIISLTLALSASLFIFRKHLQFRYPFVFLCLIFVIILLLYGFIEEYLSEYLFTTSLYADNLSTLTGRTYLWSHIFDNYINNSYSWMFGYGYHSFSRLYNYEPSRNFVLGAGMAHNATIQIIFETGILGLAFFMYFTFQSIIKLIRLWFYNNHDSEINTVIIILVTIILFQLIRGISEGAYGVPSSPDHPLMALVVVMTSRVYAKSTQTLDSIAPQITKLRLKV